MATRNKIAGNRYELEIVNRLRDTGFFPNVCSSRLASRLRDSQKIDVVNGDEDKFGRLRYNIQTKTIQNQPQYQQVLEELPKIDNIVNVFLHKKTVKQKLANGKARFLTVGNYAFLTEDDFFRMVIEIERYKTAYNILNEFFDSIDTEFQQEVHEQLSKLEL